jgi:hypothetical protein
LLECAVLDLQRRRRRINNVTERYFSSNYLCAISNKKKKRKGNVSYDNYVLTYDRLRKEKRGSQQAGIPIRKSNDKLRTTILSLTKNI